ncbi:uncharacterized protein LOC120182402 [Hibiscus syriacus]|uniref:uncharacterized protein LOC120182402 n=1 Tax=Hibiscus syriacus TaxID=106335 RepID=UPI0019235E3B|nr:uncharacterized protein LOC120182402 [Hibiscus syriacus]
MVDGTGTCDDYDAYLYSQWDMCNAAVLSWILNTVSIELSTGIMFASSAEVVWKDMKEWFDKVDGSRIYFLHREIATLSQSTSLSISYGIERDLLGGRSQILLMQHLPSVNKAYSMITQEESQRIHFSFTPGSDSTIFYSVCSSDRRCFTSICDYYKKKGISMKLVIG